VQQQRLNAAVLTAEAYWAEMYMLMLVLQLTAGSLLLVHRTQGAIILPAHSRGAASILHPCSKHTAHMLQAKHKGQISMNHNSRIRGSGLR
jgi:hypothetical protein